MIHITPGCRYDPARPLPEIERLERRLVPPAGPGWPLRCVERYTSGSSVKSEWANMMPTASAGRSGKHARRRDAGHQRPVDRVLVRIAPAELAEVGHAAAIVRQVRARRPDQLLPLQIAPGTSVTPSLGEPSILVLTAEVRPVCSQAPTAVFPGRVRSRCQAGVDFARRSTNARRSRRKFAVRAARCRARIRPSLDRTRRRCRRTSRTSPSARSASPSVPTSAVASLG